VRKIAATLALTLLASGATLAQPAGHDVETVTSQAQKIPPDTVIHDFVKSYAKPTPLMGKFARWSPGSPLCPQATGLTPAINLFVRDRIRAVAGQVGAPLAKLPCRPNMVVLFTPHPQALLDAIRNSRSDLLGYHFVAQEAAMTRVSHPIQAWYATATRDYNGVLRADDPQAFDQCVLEHSLIACSAASMGTHVKDGERSEMSTVTVVVDSGRIAGLQLGAVADYIAMLALSQTSAFETCQPLISIANLMSPDCVAQKAQELTDTDIAFLKGLYAMDPDILGVGQPARLAHQMEVALGKR
jgi:hypothetical protein